MYVIVFMQKEFKHQKKKCHKKLQLLLTVILKHPVLTSAVTEVNQAEIS